MRDMKQWLSLWLPFVYEMKDGMSQSHGASSSLWGCTVYFFFAAAFAPFFTVFLADFLPPFFVTFPALGFFGAFGLATALGFATAFVFAILMSLVVD